MAQFTTAQEAALTEAYLQCDLNPSKRPDVIVCIAGWPTLYSCVSTYTVPGTGDLSTANGFSTASMFAWAKFPDIGAQQVKGAFPEEGEFSNGKCSVEILDKHGVSTTTRDLTDLISRQARLEGNVAGTETNLTAALTKTATTINVASTTGIVAGDVIHISQEAILVGTVASGTQFTGCTRAYLLTDAAAHENAVRVYTYLPSVVGRKFWIFKGYQDLALTSWLKGWGGIITEVGRSDPGLVRIAGFGTTWEMWGGTSQGAKLKTAAVGSLRNRKAVPPGVRKIVRLGNINDAENEKLVGFGTTLGGDFGLILSVPFAVPTGLGDGHHMIKVGPNQVWCGLVNPLVSEASGSYENPNGAQVSVKVVKGVGSGATIDTGPVTAGGSPFDLGWSNAVFTEAAAPTGSDPIDLLLKLATSTGGSADEVTPGPNGAYDLYRSGVGLSLAVEKLDLTTFTGIQAQYDYDDQSKVFFVFSGPEVAKTFFDEELCKPFGWYLANGNDGRIRLVRPKNPRKLYFSRANNAFSFFHSSVYASSNPNRLRTFYLPGGVYTPTETAAALQAGFRLVTGDTGIVVRWEDGLFAVDGDYNGSQFTFTVSDAWRTIGVTSSAGPVGVIDADVVVGVFTATDFNTVTENDVLRGSIAPVENAGTRLGRIAFGCNYNWNEDQFEYQLFSDAEIENLSAYGEPNAYEINSRGLLRAFDGFGRRQRMPFSVELPPTSGCTGQLANPTSSVGIDASDSGATLFCEHLFDRYRNPPFRFKCRLKWKFNTREVGDNLLWTYAPSGVVLDAEDVADSFTDKLFEIISIKPNPGAGYVEMELLGHRKGG